MTEDEVKILDAMFRLGHVVTADDFWWYPLHPLGGARVQADLIFHISINKSRWALCWQPADGSQFTKNQPPHFDSICRQCLRAYAKDIGF